MNSKAAECKNSQADKCQFEQTKDTTEHIKATVAFNVDGKTMDITGSNFIKNNAKATVSFGGVEAKTVTVTSATAMTAAFELSIPGLKDTKPLIGFQSDG